MLNGPRCFSVSESKGCASGASERVSWPGLDPSRSVGCTSKSDRLKIVKGGLHFVDGCHTIQLEAFLNYGKLLPEDNASGYLDDPAPKLAPSSESLIDRFGS